MATARSSSSGRSRSGESSTPGDTPVVVRLNEASDDYELGTTIDGNWHSFTSIPGAAIRAAAENANAAREAADTAA